MNQNDTPDLAPRPAIPVRQEVTTPPTNGDASDALSRRTALKAFSVAAFFAMTGCGARKPERRIVSLAETPEYQKPGKALWYATTYTEGEWPYGMKVKAVEGRPIKVEGLPGHPLNDGTSDVRMQSSLLSLYDPDRLRGPKKGGKDVTWEEVDDEVTRALDAASNVVLLTGSNLGPSERELAKQFAKARRAKHFVVSGMTELARRKAWAEIYGGDGIPVPDLTKARLILSVGSDFLGTDGPVLANTAAFAAGRKLDGDPEAESLSRLWVAESAMTITGSNADHRIPLKPAHAGLFVDALKSAVEDGDAAALVRASKAMGVELEVLRALAQDLLDQEGQAVVLAGPGLDAQVYGVVARLNDTLGVRHSGALRWNPEPPTLPAGDPYEVKKALEAGPDVVILLGVNPVHDWPLGEFGALLARAKLTVGHGLTENETLTACTFALPSTHAFESWNDATPAPGVTGIAQPLIAPLFDARQEAQSLLAWTRGAPAGSWHDFVQDRIGLAGGDWWDALRRGRVGEPAWSKPRGRPHLGGYARVASTPSPDLQVVPVLHPYVLDGRFTNRSWLHELPDPVSRTVWDNAAQVGPATAKALGVSEGDVVKITVTREHFGSRALEAPVLVQPGTAKGCIVLPLGFGRTAGAGAGNGVGFNAAPLLWAQGAVKVEKTGRTHELVRMQETFDQHGRSIVRAADWGEYEDHPDFAQHRVHVPPPSQLHEEWKYDKGHKWAMAIDLNACTGCSACTIACQSENNIPVVGKEECSLGREMSWIRIDRYESGDEENPDVLQQPMLCQHCDNAPCENVCPVNATSHSPEGLNDQVYNRCVGTRYCANNCPYKVRRFNFYAYVERELKDSTQELLNNPNVTVRSRGVMEKCTFCVQRINAAKFEAANKGEKVPDGAAVPACQQACPAHAIVFGDVNTEGSEVAEKRASPLAYKVLEELNVRPNVAYLAKVRNPHGSLASAKHADEGGHR